MCTSWWIAESSWVFQCDSACRGGPACMPVMKCVRQPILSISTLKQLQSHLLHRGRPTQVRIAHTANSVTLIRSSSEGSIHHKQLLNNIHRHACKMHACTHTHVQAHIHYQHTHTHTHARACTHTHTHHACTGTHTLSTHT